MTPPRRATAAEPIDPSPDFVCACAAARQVARTLTQLYDGFLHDTGIEAPQFALLMTLYRQGASNQVALGRRYALDKTTVSRNLKVLESKGLIEATAGRNRRERQFALTAAGRRRLEAARPQWRKAQDLLRTSMTPADWESMVCTFRTVLQAADTAQRAVRRRAAR
jgi:DNA-binding MarR family transcriptional regulator